MEPFPTAQVPPTRPPVVVETSISLRRANRRRFAVGGLVAVAAFAVAYDDGTYSVQSRSFVAIAVWWLLLLAVLLGRWSVRRLRGEAAAAGGALAALAVLSLASMRWSADAGAAFGEFNRITLYLGVFLLALVVTRRRDLTAWCDGLAAGVTAVALLALASRCFPALGGKEATFGFLAVGGTRLSYPLGYWNGLAVFVAIGIPLLLRRAIVEGSPVARGVALAPFPALAAVLYLTSSRSGFLAALLAVLLIFVLSQRRATLTGALVVASVTSAGAIAVLLRRDALVNGPLATAAARHQGWTAAIEIGALCAVTFAAYASAVARLTDQRAPAGLERGLLVVGAVVVAAAVMLAHPIKRAHEFTTPVGTNGPAGTNYAQAHLLSGGGNGRWDYWRLALHEFEQHPIVGEGASSYPAYWLQHRPARVFVRDAHSLYFQTLGELGIVGLAFVLTFVFAGIVAGARRIREVDGDERVTVVTILAGFLGLAFGAGLDWVWELPAVTFAGLACLALLVGAATDRRPSIERPRLDAAVTAVAVAAIALPVIGAQLVLMYADLKLRNSQSAVVRGDGASAASAALAARRLEPWSSAPSLQLALVEEQLGNLPLARVYAVEATQRTARDSSAWLVRARIETKLGDIPAARSSLRHARALDPLTFPPT